MTLTGVSLVVSLAGLLAGVGSPAGPELGPDGLVVAPGLGPLLFAVLHDPPPVQPSVDRAVGGDWDSVPNEPARHHAGHDQ